MSRKYIASYRSRTRSMAIRYTVSISVLVLIVAVLQVSLFGNLQIMGAVPDLCICTVLLIAYFFGPYAGAITGIGAGFVIEALGTFGISVLPVVYLFVGYITGHYAKGVSVKRFPPYLIYLGIILLIRAATTVGYACMTYQYIDLPKILLQSVLPEALLTAVCGCALYPALKLFCRLVEGRQGAAPT